MHPAAHRKGVVKIIVTDKAAFELVSGGRGLKEIAAGSPPETRKASTDADFTVAPDRRADQPSGQPRSAGRNCGRTGRGNPPISLIRSPKR